MSVLLVTMAVIALAGCTGSKDDARNGSNEPTATATDTSDTATNGLSGNGLDNSPFKFNAYMNYTWLEQSDFTWGADPISKYIKERTGADIEWIIPVGDAEQKLNTYIASNTLPDVMWLDRGPMLQKLMNSGMLLPLDEYVNDTQKYPEYTQMIPKQVIDILRGQDGHIYATPNWYTDANHPLSDPSLVINNKIYKELGSPPLETHQDFNDYLKLVKESGLKVEGKDVIPLSIKAEGGALGNVARSFGAHASGYYPLGDGTLKHFLNDPRFKEALRWLNEGYRGGLIAKDALLIKHEQQDELGSSGRFAVMFTELSKAREYNEVLEKDIQDRLINEDAPGYKLIPLPLHDGLSREDLALGSFSTVGWNVAVVSKTAKNPERIFQWINYMVSEEGQRITLYGPPGYIYDRVDGNNMPVIKHDKLILSDEELEALGYDKWSWLGSTIYDTAPVSYEIPEDAANARVKYQKWHDAHKVANIKNTTEFNELDPDPTSPEGIINQQITDYWDKTAYPVLLMANSAEKFEQEYEKTVKALYGMGLEKLEQAWTLKYKENIEKLKG